jgi:hypothetical protein
MQPRPTNPYAASLALVTSYAAAMPETAPECLLMELLGRGPAWFGRWWRSASPATRQAWLTDARLAPSVAPL